MRTFYYYYECRLIIGSREIKRIVHPDDVCGLIKVLDNYKIFVEKQTVLPLLEIRPKYDIQFDLFNCFTMIDNLYDALCAVTNNYSILTPEFQEMFSEEFLVELRNKVFKVSLLNKI